MRTISVPWLAKSKATTKQTVILSDAITVISRGKTLDRQMNLFCN